MSLKQYEKNGACIIVLPAQLMMADCNEVRASFNQILESNTLPVLVDFSELVFMDSSGLGVLVNVYQTTKDADRMFALYNIKPTVLSLIELTQLDQVFNIYADEQGIFDAVALHKKKWSMSEYLRSLINVKQPIIIYQY